MIIPLVECEIVRGERLAENSHRTFLSIKRGIETVSDSQNRHAQRQSFPQQRATKEAVLERLEQFSAEMTSEIAGKLSVNSLKGRADIQHLVENAYLKFFPYNALFTRQERGAAKIENELLDICVEIFNGGEQGQANLTSGGTESIFCALHAMREWAKIKYPHIREPEVVAPYSLHATFNKGAHFLGLKIVRVPVGEDFLADTQAIECAITDNTIGIAASAPSWPYGLVDPIEELGQLAIERDLWLHVDACVGGYILPFMRKAGCEIPAYDFSVPGVSSISADLHKYGYAPKPCSTVLYRSERQQQFHYVPVTEWPCGLYLSQSFMGSRPFASTAAAWAVMNYLGEQGYVENAKHILHVKQAIQDTVREIGGLSSWDTHGPLMMIIGQGLDIQQVTGGMRQRGWVLLGILEPAAIHLTVDPMPEDALQKFCADLKQIAAAVKAGENVEQGSLNYGGAGGDDAPKWLQGAIHYMEQDQAVL